MKHQESNSDPILEINDLKAPKSMTRQISHKEPQNQIKNLEADNIYEYILNLDVIKNISIVGTVKEQLTNQKPFTAYVVKVDTDSFDYIIKRRYSEFERLHELIILKNKDAQLPEFPKKTWFKAQDEKTIQRRQKLLLQLLQTILSKLKRERQYDFLDFLDLREQFKKRGIVDIKQHNLSGDVWGQLKEVVHEPKQYKPINDEEQMGFMFMQTLNSDLKSRGKIFQQMEKLLVNRMFGFSYSMLQLMFIGDSEFGMQGILEMLAPQCQEHIVCVPGFKFLRKILEFEYNPHAEVVLKAFSELSFKQIKRMQAELHIGHQNQNCKNDALFVLRKYFEFNGMNDQFIHFMLEDDVAYEEYISYKTNKQNSNCQFRFKLEGDQSSSSWEQLQSNMKEQQDLTSSTRSLQNLQLSVSCPQVNDMSSYLELKCPTADELYQQVKHKDTKWKLVLDNEICSLRHIQGKISFSKFKQLETSMENAFKLFTSDVQKWNKYYRHHEIILQETEQESIKLLKQIWEKDTTQILDYIQKQYVHKSDDLIIIKSNSLQNLLNYQHFIGKSEEVGYKCSYIKIKRTPNNKVNVTVYQHLQDFKSQASASKVLLNENNDFIQQAECLLKFISSEK